MYPRILVIVNDRDTKSVFEPLLHLYEMVALRADNLQRAQQSTLASPVSAVVLQTGCFGRGQTVYFLKWIRSLTGYQTTPLVLLTADNGFEEDEAIAARALGARVFRYPQELDPGTPQ
jgi:DNA-binding response OmpR family regulator